MTPLRPIPACLLGLALLAPLLSAQATGTGDAGSVDGDLAAASEEWALPALSTDGGTPGVTKGSAPSTPSTDGGTPKAADARALPAPASGTVPAGGGDRRGSEAGSAAAGTAGTPRTPAAGEAPSATGLPAPASPPGETAGAKEATDPARATTADGTVPAPAIPPGAASPSAPATATGGGSAAPTPTEAKEPHPRWSVAVTAGLHDVPRGPLDPLSDEFRAYASVGVGYWIERHFSIDLSAGHYLPRGETELLLGANQAQLPWKRLIPLDFLPEALTFSFGFSAGTLISSNGSVRLMFAPSGGVGWRFSRNWSVNLGYTHGLVVETYARSRTGLVLTFAL